MNAPRPNPRAAELAQRKQKSTRQRAETIAAHPLPTLEQLEALAHEAIADGRHTIELTVYRRDLASSKAVQLQAACGTRGPLSSADHPPVALGEGRYRVRWVAQDVLVSIRARRWKHTGDPRGVR